MNIKMEDDILTSAGCSIKKEMASAIMEEMVIKEEVMPVVKEEVMPVIKEDMMPVIKEESMTDMEVLQEDVMLNTKSGEEVQFAYTISGTSNEAEAALLSCGQPHHKQELVDNQEIIINKHVRTVSIKHEISDESIGNHSNLYIVPTGNKNERGENDNDDGSGKAYEIIDQMSNQNVCSNCGNAHISVGSLKLHMNWCLRQKGVGSKDDKKCNFCKKVFQRRDRLKQHLLTVHYGETVKKCHRCFRKFFDKEKFKAHIEEHKLEDELKEQHDGKYEVAKAYTCSCCSQHFSVVFEVGCVKRRFVCDPCRDKLSHADKLKQTEKRTFEKLSCDKCNRTFAYQGFFQRHIPLCDGTPKKRYEKKRII